MNISRGHALKRISGIYMAGLKAFGNMPWLLRVGATIFVLSGAVDLFYHAVSPFWPGRLDAYLGPDGYYVHLVLFIGMVLIIIGVIRTRPAADSSFGVAADWPRGRHPFNRSEGGQNRA